MIASFNENGGKRMKKFLYIFIPIAFIIFVGMIILLSNLKNKENQMPINIYEVKVKAIDGTEKSLADYKGKVLLIVNVASKCGFTPQYEGLEKLYKQHKDKGLEILAFPCNQFGNQEPGNSEEIKNFCTLTYKTTFPLFEKIEVNGAKTHPLYIYLKAEKPGLLGIEAIKWNFTKFLVDKKGKVVERYAPQTTPEEIGKEIEKLLLVSSY